MKTLKNKLMVGLLGLGALSMYACGDNREREREQRIDEPMDQVPLPEEDMRRDTVPTDSIPARPGVPATP